MSSEEIQQLHKEVRTLNKLVRKVYNYLLDPSGEKSAERHKNSGFNRPQKVSEELRTFLSLGADETISRSEVTKRINEYIKSNELKHPENGRMIVPDEKLKKLLKPTDPLSYLNMQKYLNPHYIKEEKKEKKAETKPKVKKTKA
jgi:chromatin remodeling complex protein RSC6